MRTNWLVLTATLPTRPSGLRVRVWRALKATGAGTLREGVYVLPQHAPTANTLCELERTIVDAGAEAHLLELEARDDTQDAAFRSLFDRSEAYAALRLAVQEARSSTSSASSTDLRKLLRQLELQLQSLIDSDFFPGRDQEDARVGMSALRREIELALSPDEPGAARAVVAVRSRAEFQRRTWVTRPRPWVDRLATAWLIQRFIDDAPTFVWLDAVQHEDEDAVGYDFDGAYFTHVGDLVTFEVVAQSFGLLADFALQRLAQLVHYVDVGGTPVDEASGLETLVRGLQVQHLEDHALLLAAFPIFDAFYAAFKVPHDR